MMSSFPATVEINVEMNTSSFLAAFVFASSESNPSKVQCPLGAGKM